MADLGFWNFAKRDPDKLALVDPDPFDDLPDHPPRNATALFEYHRGRWRSEGTHLDEVQPHEAFLRNRRFEPFTHPQRRS